jgi:exoribonuclease II
LQHHSTSVYFPEQVIPMLPEILSNGLCSINPDEDRLCMVCEMLINEQGQVTRAKFFDATQSVSPGYQNPSRHEFHVAHAWLYTKHTFALNPAKQHYISYVALTVFES